MTKQSPVIDLTTSGSGKYFQPDSGKSRRPSPLGKGLLAGVSLGGGDERMSPASTTDFDVNVLVTALSELASLTSAQISR
jgi:hypothetical protein